MFNDSANNQLVMQHTQTQVGIERKWRMFLFMCMRPAAGVFRHRGETQGGSYEKVFLVIMA